MRSWIGKLVAAVIAAALALLAAPVAESIALAPVKLPSTYVYPSHHHPGGKVLGPNGQPIDGRISDNPQAHIPLNEWLTWSSWGTP